MLLGTGRQIGWGRPPGGHTRRVGRLVVSDRALLGLALAAAVALVALWLGRPPDVLLPFLPAGRAYLQPAIIGLAGVGLEGLAVATAPLPSAIALMLFISAFALFYSILDPSITAVVALVVLQMTVALVAAYLAGARHAAGNAVE